MLHLTRQQLYDLVWSKPMTQAAAELGISDVGLKKACRRHCIPAPFRGYWARIAVGQKLSRPPLPPLENGQRNLIEIRPPMPKPAPPPPPPVPAAVQAAIDNEQKPENRITVAKTLRNPHRIVLAWAEEDQRNRHLHRHDHWYLQTYKPLDGDPLSRRRLLIQSALFTALEQRAYKLVIESPYRRVVQVERTPDRVEIVVEERIQQVRRTLSDKEHRERGYLSTGRKRWTRERHPTGEFLAGIREVNSRRYLEQWRESKERPLEDQLNEIMVGVARQLDKQRAYREHREAERKRQWEEDRKRYEREQERKRETIRFRRLVQQARDRHTAAEIRPLVEAVLDQQRAAVSADNAKFERWRGWALAHADRIDPLLDDDLFDLTVSDRELYAFNERSEI